MSMYLKFQQRIWTKVKNHKGHERYEPIFGDADLMRGDSIVPGTDIDAWFYDAYTTSGESYREGPFETIEDAIADAQEKVVSQMHGEEEDEEAA